jgi:hypothetical protein
MTKIDERASANMDVVLEKACRDLPNGGDHESRKYVAKKLMQSVKKGNVTLEGLRPVARRVLLNCRAASRLSSTQARNSFTIPRQFPLSPMMIFA